MTTVSSPLYAGGKGGGGDEFLKNCCFRGEWLFLLSEREAYIFGEAFAWGVLAIFPQHVCFGDFVVFCKGLPNHNVPQFQKVS